MRIVQHCVTALSQPVKAGKSSVSGPFCCDPAAMYLDLLVDVLLPRPLLEVCVLEVQPSAASRKAQTMPSF